MADCRHASVLLKKVKTDGDPRIADTAYYLQCQDCGDFKPAFIDLTKILRSINSAMTGKTTI